MSDPALAVTTSQPSSFQSGSSRMGRVWEVAVVVALLSVIGALIGALLFVRRRRNRAERNRLQRELERRHRIRSPSKPPPFSPNLPSPPPSKSFESAIRKSFDTADTQIPQSHV